MLRNAFAERKTSTVILRRWDLLEFAVWSIAFAQDKEKGQEVRESMMSSSCHKVTVLSNHYQVSVCGGLVAPSLGWPIKALSIFEEFLRLYCGCFHKKWLKRVIFGGNKSRLL